MDVDDNKKYWRYSNIEDFYEDAIKYVDNHINDIENNINTFNKNKIERLKRLIDEYRSYQKSRKLNTRILLRKAIKIVDIDVENWADFSTDVNSSLKDIIIRILLGIMYDTNYVSILLLSCNGNIYEDFIEDTIYITSDYFEFENWDDEHVNAICDCASKIQSPRDNEYMKKLYDPFVLKDERIKVKFDIKHFEGNDLSDEFHEKYKRFIYRV